MKALGNSESAKEIAKLKKRNSLKSPVRTKVLNFEGKTKDDLKSPEKRYQSQSPTRSKSPGVNKDRPNQFLSPTRSQSPGISGYRSPSRSRSLAINIERPNKLFSPTRSKSPGINSDTSSPIRSKSPGINSDTSSPSRSKSPGIKRDTSSPGRSKSPGVKRDTSSPGRNKSPGINSDTSSPSRSKSPGIKRLHLSQSSPGGKWTRNDNSWMKDSPDVTGTNPRENTPTRSSPEVGDTNFDDVAWYIDNLDYLDAGGASQKEPGPSQEVERKKESDKRMTVNEEETKDRFRNVLNYDMAAWEEVTSGEPKKADEFIQRLCDQVRNQVEYMCDMNLVSYQAISYKVNIAGPEGILYYVKVNVWENYCIHLRIFSHKNEFKATPKLQAILERGEPDRGNIEFF